MQKHYSIKIREPSGYRNVCITSNFTNLQKQQQSIKLLKVIKVRTLQTGNLTNKTLTEENIMSMGIGYPAEMTICSQTPTKLTYSLL